MTEITRTDLLAVLIKIRNGLADTGSDRNQRLTLMTKVDAYEIARSAVAKVAGGAQ